MQRLTFPFPFVHHQSHVYQQPRPSGTTINRGNEDWMLLMNEIDPIPLDGHTILTVKRDRGVRTRPRSERNFERPSIIPQLILVDRPQG